MGEIRHLSRKSFANVPHFRCSVCFSGILAPVIETLGRGATAGSRRDMEGLSSCGAVLDIQRFTMILRCENIGCMETVVMTGEIYEEPYQSDDGSVASTTMYEPNFIGPAKGRPKELQA